MDEELGNLRIEHDRITTHLSLLESNNSAARGDLESVRLKKKSLESRILLSEENAKSIQLKFDAARAKFLDSLETIQSLCGYEDLRKNDKPATSEWVASPSLRHRQVVVTSIVPSLRVPRMFALDVLPEDSPEALKHRIYKKFGLPIHYQDVRLPPGNRRVCDCLDSQPQVMLSTTCGMLGGAAAGGANNNVGRHRDSSIYAPEPWEACRDEENRLYYYNKDTGDTAWELPEEVLDDNRSEISEMVSVASGSIQVEIDEEYDDMFDVANEVKSGKDYRKQASNLAMKRNIEKKTAQAESLLETFLLYINTKFGTRSKFGNEYGDFNQYSTWRRYIESKSGPAKRVDVTGFIMFQAWKYFTEERSGSRKDKNGRERRYGTLTPLTYFQYAQREIWKVAQTRWEDQWSEFGNYDEGLKELRNSHYFRKINQLDLRVFINRALTINKAEPMFLVDAKRLMRSAPWTPFGHRACAMLACLMKRGLRPRCLLDIGLDDIDITKTANGPAVLFRFVPIKQRDTKKEKIPFLISGYSAYRATLFIKHRNTILWKNSDNLFCMESVEEFDNVLTRLCWHAGYPHRYFSSYSCRLGSVNQTLCQVILTQSQNYNDAVRDLESRLTHKTNSGTLRTYVTEIVGIVEKYVGQVKNFMNLKIGQVHPDLKYLCDDKGDLKSEPLKGRRPTGNLGYSPEMWKRTDAIYRSIMHHGVEDIGCSADDTSTASDSDGNEDADTAAIVAADEFMQDPTRRRKLNRAWKVIGDFINEHHRASHAAAIFKACEESPDAAGSEATRLKGIVRMLIHSGHIEPNQFDNRIPYAAYDSFARPTMPLEQPKIERPRKYFKVTDSTKVLAIWNNNTKRVRRNEKGSLHPAISVQSVIVPILDLEKEQVVLRDKLINEGKKVTFYRLFGLQSTARFCPVEFIISRQFGRENKVETFKALLAEATRICRGEIEPPTYSDSLSSKLDLANEFFENLETFDNLPWVTQGENGEMNTFQMHSNPFANHGDLELDRVNETLNKGWDFFSYGLSYVGTHGNETRQLEEQFGAMSLQELYGRQSILTPEELAAHKEKAKKFRHGRKNRNKKKKVRCKNRREKSYRDFQEYEHSSFLSGKKVSAKKSQKRSVSLGTSRRGRTNKRRRQSSKVDDDNDSIGGVWPLRLSDLPVGLPYVNDSQDEDYDGDDDDGSFPVSVNIAGPVWTSGTVLHAAARKQDDVVLPQNSASSSSPCSASSSSDRECSGGGPSNHIDSDHEDRYRRRPGPRRRRNLERDAASAKAKNNVATGLLNNGNTW